jgi:cyanate lyase
MLTREDVRRLALEAKGRLGLTWPQVGEAVGRSPVYAALLIYGYGQASPEEAEALSRALNLPQEVKGVLMQAPHRTPAQPWPPTDPFVYRLYEVVMLYGPVFKDVAHELFGDGIMKARARTFPPKSGKRRTSLPVSSRHNRTVSFTTFSSATREASSLPSGERAARQEAHSPTTSKAAEKAVEALAGGQVQVENLIGHSHNQGLPIRREGEENRLAFQAAEFAGLFVGPYLPKVDLLPPSPRQAFAVGRESHGLEAV